MCTAPNWNDYTQKALDSASSKHCSEDLRLWSWANERNPSNIHLFSHWKWRQREPNEFPGWWRLSPECLPDEGLLYLSIEKLGETENQQKIRVALYDRLEPGRVLTIRIDTWSRNSFLHILPRKQWSGGRRNCSSWTLLAVCFVYVGSCYVIQAGLNSSTPPASTSPMLELQVNAAMFGVESRTSLSRVDDIYGPARIRSKGEPRRGKIENGQLQVQL